MIIAHEDIPAAAAAAAASVKYGTLKSVALSLTLGSCTHSMHPPSLHCPLMQVSFQSMQTPAVLTFLHMLSAAGGLHLASRYDVFEAHPMGLNPSTLKGSSVRIVLYASQVRDNCNEGRKGDHIGGGFGIPAPSKGGGLQCIHLDQRHLDGSVH